MSKNEENSVMFALAELQQLESNRREEGVQRQATEEAARLEVERAVARRVADEKAQAECVAEAEARLRVNAELGARDADAERRLTGLRKQLEAVQAERARLHASIVMSADEVRAPAEDTRGARGWAFAFGSMSLVAGLLGALLFTQTPEIRIVDVPFTEPPPIAAADPLPEPEVLEPTVAEVEVPADVPEVRVTRRTPRTPTPRARPRPDSSEGVFDALDRCGDDPTCGLTMR